LTDPDLTDLKIVADENIPHVQAAFAHLGSVTLIPGRSITPSHVKDADLLLVRSVTAVGRGLVHGSRVQFVGSATIGLDHVDLAYLRERGIGFAYAPGSNANSVAEYVIAAILTLHPNSVAGLTLGIIGLGRIGNLVQTKADALGIKVLANDPPLERSGRTGLVSLEKLLQNSDIVTCHVPLITEGSDATHHLLNQRTLGMLGPAAVLINTARGPVVDNAALLEALNKGGLGGAVLDVWEGEPCPEPALIRAVAIGTPHIAGYSLDGKIKGTQMLYEAACAQFQRAPHWAPSGLSMERGQRVIIDANRPLLEIVRVLVQGAYDIRRDDAACRIIADLSTAERSQAFDRLRATYPARWEFHNVRLLLSDASSDHTQPLTRLGFTVEATTV